MDTMMDNMDLSDPHEYTPLPPALPPPPAAPAVLNGWTAADVRGDDDVVMAPTASAAAATTTTTASSSASVTVPDAFLCPIAQALMLDPVVTCDGHSYERSAIEDWFTRSSLSPLTGAELSHTHLVSNGMARSLIREFVEQHPTLPECAELRERVFVWHGRPLGGSTE